MDMWLANERLQTDDALIPPLGLAWSSPTMGGQKKNWEWE